ncbi:fluoride efflux transporter CrcB [Staphylococcus canis]|uniref:Fluoride-specific ion channel FluC n=1 Tax=Staphylococcus canis TaxID=2724942 RepID=A0ABS0TCJ6_9STAP|nr:fluoride efflux transporter CrcB [Staphylococcus canis]MBI5975696.1 fluoride efflux transporter CrcB [Staphylococcus canis]
MKYIFVFTGAMLGALLRYTISFLPNWHLFPIGTFLCNIIGAFLMGYLTIFFKSRIQVPQYLKKGLTTGLMGALTTFSTFQFELVTLLEHHHIEMLLIYALTSYIIGIAACFIGIRLGEV